MSRPKGLRTESSADLFYVWASAALFAGALIGASFVPAKAETSSPSCFSPEFVKKTSKAKSIAPIITEYDGQAAVEYIARFNSAGKPTSYSGDYVLQWAANGRPAFQVAIFKAGCMSVLCIYRVGCKSTLGNKPKEISA